MVTALQMTLASTLPFHFTALVVKPSPYRHFVIAPIILGTAYFFRSSLNYRSAPEYSHACLILLHLFIASDYILLTDVQRDLIPKGQKELAYRLSLFQSVKWAASLFTNPRYIAWSHEPTHALPPRPPPSVTRQKFVLQELGRLARDVVLFEVFTTYSMRTDYFSAVRWRRMVDYGKW